MKKAYLAISFSDRNLFNKEIEYITQILSKRNISLLVFVDKYNFDSNQEKEMMKTAFEEIDNSDIFIAELTKKSIGVGIELGYAHSKQKPIIYIRKKDSLYSTTASGCSKYIIEYENIFELGGKIKSALEKESHL